MLGHKVIGETKIRNRSMIAIKPLIDWSEIRSYIGKEFSFDENTLFYVDKKTGILSNVNSNFSILGNGIKLFYLEWIFDTVFAKSNHPKIENINTIDLNKFEQKCAEIGFTKGTEKYADCVMKLYK